MISLGKSLISYPIFRLTFFMAAGIFIFDTYLSGVATVTSVALMWVASLFTVLFLSCSIRHYRPLLYGVVLALSFFLFGGTVVLLQRHHIHYAWPHTACLYEGILRTLPQEKLRSYAFDVDVHSVFTQMGDTSTAVPVHRKVRLYLRKDSLSASLSRGESLRFMSEIVGPHTGLQSQNSHYGEYLIHQGISGTAFAEAGKWERIPLPIATDFRLLALSVRDQLSARFRNVHLLPEEQAVLAALTIGDKRELTPELKSIYTASGTSHILALSGMHVGIITLILFTFLSPLVRLPYGQSLRYFLVVLLLWVFSFITGLSSSVVRAVSMFTLYALAALVAEGKFQSCNALTLTAFLMLSFCPFYLFEVGFQLSFAAVFSIIFFYPAFRNVLVLRNPVVRYVWNVMCLSLSAQLGTLPLVLYHFGAFPTYFLVANILVAPLAFAILFTALLALAFAAVPWLGAAIFEVLHFLLHFLNSSMEWIYGLYGAQLTSLHISAAQMITLYLLFLFVYLYVCRHTVRRLQLSLSAFILFLFLGMAG